MALIEKPSSDGVEGFTVAVAGLGLMGGSVAKALKARTGARVLGMDRDAGVVAQCLADGCLDAGGTAAADVLPQADLLVVCLYPTDAVRFIIEHMALLKPGAVITDICGVKQPVIEGVLPCLRADVDYVPGHPMAGRERGGYAFADEKLFERCNYILTPLPGNKPDSVEIMSRFAGALGAGNIILTTPAEHDEMIAYTSQLPHVLAVAYVLGAGERDPLPFSAGSYRDVSRVAAINAPMWAELFLQNSGALLDEMQKMKNWMEQMEQQIKQGDRQALEATLAAAAKAREAGR